MCGVIVVDPSRSRSTNLGCDAYILIIALDIVITIPFSINCPTVICLPTMCYFLRETTSEIYAPGSILYHICFPIYYLPLLFSDLLFQKPKKYFAALFCYLFYFAFYRDLFTQSITSRQLGIFWRRYP